MSIYSAALPFNDGLTGPKTSPPGSPSNRTPTSATPERTAVNASFSSPHLNRAAQSSRSLFNDVSANKQGTSAISDFRSVSPVRRLVYPGEHYNNNGFRIDSLRSDNDTIITATYPVNNFKRNINNVEVKKRNVHEFLLKNYFTLPSQEITECKYVREKHLSKDDFDQIIKGIKDILDISTSKLEFTL